MLASLFARPRRLGELHIANKATPLLLIFGCFLCPAAVNGQSNGQALVLTNANVIDGVSPEPIPNATIIVADGKIQKIARDAEAPSGAKVIDLHGKYVTPGLIDAHVHIRTFDAAKRALMSGVTTARSMGTPHFVDVGLRDLAKAGKIEAPELLAAGYHVRPRMADAFFMDTPAMANLMDSEVHGTQAIRKVGKVMVDHRVDWIKTNATARAGLPETDPREPYYNEAEMKALVEEGANAGIPVAAHAHGDEGGRAAVLGGVRSIEHGTYLSEETLKIMAQRGTFLVPTIAVVSDLTEPGGDYDNPFLLIRGRHMLPRIRETAEKAHKMGVKLVAATDTGYGPNSTLRLSLELEELVRIGLTSFQALQAATSVAAEMLKIDNHTGRLAVGLDADFIAMERNPLEDIGAIHDLLMVVNDGKIILNRLEW
ncbi:amidohydrolase family protein [bacterium]|nr:amidohydrolase family protein [bacterium]